MVLLSELVAGEPAFVAPRRFCMAGLLQKLYDNSIPTGIYIEQNDNAGV
jgi:hypothetical protein